MENQPIFTTNTAPEATETPPKSFNLKLFSVVVAVVVALAGAIVLVVNLLKDNSEFVEDGGKSLPNLSESKYVELKDYDVSFEELESFYEEEIEEKITLFFTYLKPEFKTLTLVSTDYSENTPETEDDTSGGYKTTVLTLKSDTGERFTASVLIRSPKTNGYELVIEDASGKEIYSYTAGDITKDLYAGAEYDSLLDVILDKLPHTGELESGAKFEITYEGEDGDRLTVSPAGGSFSTEDCKNALSAAADWANSLELKYSKEITENNFTCEL